MFVFSSDGDIPISKTVSQTGQQTVDDQNAYGNEGLIQRRNTCKTPMNQLKSNGYEN